ncbi:signal peptidase I [Actinomadura montaniterrae]|uniref:Signal peptidase I n=1 Tax=Actinomadura montaniterrae TaxID=1803903 RepID=A0A6L3VWS2_9ACTN|nr:signal peptidase I [Actinomadura montaniterrae]KAB2384597.1 signal peptidase I [Actinomadura montaniterrae]
MHSSSDGAAPREEDLDRSAPGDEASERPSGGAEPGAGDGSAEPAKKKRKGSFWKELPVLIVVAVVLALVVKTFLVQAFYIPSGSMQNTLEIGDRVLVNKVVYHTRDVKRGDIVVFNGMDSWDPEVTYEEPTNPVSRFFRWVGSAFGVAPGEKDYIKRVIGVPGDHVKCCDAQGRVSVNGTALDERSYLYTDPVTHEQNKPSDQPFDVTVKPGTLWVMGDHRELSADSRAHQKDPGGGAIPEDRVIGRAFVVVWPVNRMKMLHIPGTFDQTIGGLAPAAPFALGMAAATPVVLLRRRLRKG